MRVVLFGGTGTVGSAVARQLREKGPCVRIATRDPDRARERFGEPGYEIAAADARTGAGVAAAVDGSDGVFIAIDHPEEDHCVEGILAAAAASRVQRVMYVSGGTVRRENAWFPLVAGKLRAETRLEWSGLPWTVLAPGWFYETLARFVRDGRATVIGRGRRRYHWIAAADFGRIAARMFVDDIGANERFIIHGPEVMRIGEALDRYRAALHPEIRKVSHPPTFILRWVARKNPGLKYAIDLMTYFAKVGEPGGAADAEALAGGELTPFDTWLERERERMVAEVWARA